MTRLDEIKLNRRIWHSGLGQTTKDIDDLISIIDTAINSCKDVTTLQRFAPAVDPVRWVEQLQAHLETKN